MKIAIVKGWDVEVSFEFNGDTQMWLLPETQLRSLQAAALAHLAADESEENSAVVVVLFARIHLGDVSPWADQLVARFDRWCWQNQTNFFALAANAIICPALTWQLILQRYSLNMRSLAQCALTAGYLGSHEFDTFVALAALHRDAERRQYFFEVATDFQRLVVPGSLTWKPSDAVLEQIFAAALHDESASVRERAIVYAYGLGWVQRLSGELLRLSRDPVEAVRQYALVALGIADDDESLSVLFAALDGDRKPEMQSAIWALARRRQGLSRLLTMAGDARPWVVDDILGAIKQVSLPLTDEQLDEVRARVVVPRDEIQFERVFKHHRWRTRDPEGKELPPDRIMRYEMKGAM